MRKPEKAFTASEKIAKGEMILTKSETLLRGGGLESLSMNKLAESCNIAKGTLYLYFESRNEILATLYQAMLWEWITRFEKSIQSVNSYEAFCETYARTLTHDPLLLQMALLAQAEFDKTLPPSTLIEYKRSFRDILERQAEIFAQILGVDEIQATSLVWAFHVAVLGAAQFPKIHDPSLNGDLPDELNEFSKALRFETLFKNTVMQFAL